MAGKVRWGVLGTARIATLKVIPAMQRGRWSTIGAIASRDPARAERAAADLDIPKAHGSYEALVADPSIDAIYIPLPNHLHRAWTIRAAEAGKHVLCEKPIGLTEADVRALIEVRDRTGVKIQEAFMVRTHPQWLWARDAMKSGRLGTLQAILGAFSYRNLDPANIRNVREYGGGALYDIGCYFVMTARFMFGEEPRRVAASIEWDPTFGVDRRTSILLEFASGSFAGTCGTQLSPFQRVQILGSLARLEIEIPFNAPPDRPCHIFVDSDGLLDRSSTETIDLPPCDQYTIQGDLLSQAILNGTPVVYPLEESLANARVIDALFRAAADGTWARVTE